MAEPDAVTFRASRLKGGLLLLGASAFVAIGLLMRHEQAFMGWLCVGFFGLGIPVALVLLARPGLIYLRLDAEGFEMGSPIKKYRVRWQDVEGFDLGSISGTKLIAIRYRESYLEQRMLRGVAGSLTGMEAAIPNNYDAPQAVVLETLREFHERHGYGP